MLGLRLPSRQPESTLPFEGDSPPKKMRNSAKFPLLAMAYAALAAQPRVARRSRGTENALSCPYAGSEQ